MAQKPAIPAVVRVSGKEYEVLPERQNRLGVDRCGEASHRELIITYDESWADQQIRDIVWHEVLHCCEEVAGLSLKEREIQALATLTLGVLWDNEDLAKWLLSKG